MLGEEDAAEMAAEATGKPCRDNLQDSRALQKTGSQQGTAWQTKDTTCPGSNTGRSAHVPGLCYTWGNWVPLRCVVLPKETWGPLIPSMSVPLGPGPWRLPPPHLHRAHVPLGFWEETCPYLCYACAAWSQTGHVLRLRVSVTLSHLSALKAYCLPGTQ